MTASNLTLPDNPASLDYLGFEELVDPIVETVDSTAEPITVGIYGPWGSGKSSVLAMVAKKLNQERSDVVVVPLNPWGFDDTADIKGALIGAVLAELETKFGSDAGEDQVPAPKGQLVAGNLCGAQGCRHDAVGCRRARRGVYPRGG